MAFKPLNEKCVKSQVAFNDGYVKPLLTFISNNIIASISWPLTAWIFVWISLLFALNII